MSLKSVHHLGSRGDTIVEVLIALAILGSALGIGYVTGGRSLNGTTQAEEHSVALKIAQAQVEILTANSANSTLYSSTPYCLSSSVSPVPLTGSFPATPDGETDFSEYPAACVQSGLYHIAIVYSGTSPNDIFTANVRWPSIISHDTNSVDNVTLVYKVHQPQ